MTKKIKLKKFNGNNKLSKKDIAKAKLAKYLTLGLSLEEACKLVDCTKNLLGQLRSDPDFESFVEQCEMQNKADHLECIKNANAWMASSWFLEKKYPNEYGRKDIIRKEYTVKIQTLSNIFLQIINEEAPEIKYRIVKKLREFNFDGTGVMDHSFKALSDLKDVDYEDV